MPNPAQVPPRQEIDDEQVLAPPDGNAMVMDEVHEALIEQGVVKQDFSGECWFVGAPLRDKEKKLAKALVRMRRNLGHPRPEDFARALAVNKQVAPEAVSLSRRLRCATCERTRRPPPPRPTSLKVMGPCNSKLAMDFVYAPDANGDNYMFLHVLEPNGGFNVFYPCASRVPEEVFDVFCTIWCSWAGFPDVIMLDQDGAFEGRFQELLQGVGTNLEHCAADSHWQLGEFGKDPKAPIDILSPDGKMQAMEALDQDTELRRRHVIQTTADLKIAEFKVNDALRRAVLRQGRPGRQSYEAREPVAFWREARQRKDPRARRLKRMPAGWHRGTIIGPRKGDPSQSNFWVSSGGRCLLVSREQLRAAYGSELWRVDESVLNSFLDNGNGPDDFRDERGEPPPEDAPVPDFFPEVDHAEEFDLDDVGEPQTPPPPAQRAEHVDSAPQEEESVGTDLTQPSPSSRPLGRTEAASSEPATKRLRINDVLLEGAVNAQHLADRELERLMEEPLEEAMESNAMLVNKYVPVTQQEYYALADCDFIETYLPGLQVIVALAMTRKAQISFARYRGTCRKNIAKPTRRLWRRSGALG